MAYKKEIGLDVLVAQTAGLVAADMDGEKVMLDIETGKYYGLNGIGSSIWELIEQPRTVQQVVAELLKAYNVEEGTCQYEVLEFLNKLHAQGLVAIA